jgi:hypothetical protein
VRDVVMDVIGVEQSNQYVNVQQRRTPPAHSESRNSFTNAMVMSGGPAVCLYLSPATSFGAISARR